jgi:hypothetical protein
VFEKKWRRSRASDLRVVKCFDTSIDPTGITIGFAIVAVGVGLMQYRLFSGKSGIGAFLQDGKNYANSAYEPSNEKRTVVLPWLKLPKFEYVEVFGDEDDIDDGFSRIVDAEFVTRLDDLRSQLKRSISNRDVEKARRLRVRLEELLEGSGYEFKEDNDRSGM